MAGKMIGAVAAVLWAQMGVAQVPVAVPRPVQDARVTGLNLQGEAAIDALQAEMAKLRARVAASEQAIDKLEAKLAAVEKTAGGAHSVAQAVLKSSDATAAGLKDLQRAYVGHYHYYKHGAFDEATDKKYIAVDRISPPGEFCKVGPGMTALSRDLQCSTPAVP